MAIINTVGMMFFDVDLSEEDSPAGPLLTTLKLKRPPSYWARLGTALGGGYPPRVGGV